MQDFSDAFGLAFTLALVLVLITIAVTVNAGVMGLRIRSSDRAHG